MNLRQAVTGPARARIGKELRLRGWTKRSDPDEGLHVVETLRRLRVDLVIDVGANRGEFASMIRKGGYAGRIASFEPVQQSFEELRRVAAQDGLWVTRQRALGSESGRLSINVTKNSVFSSFLPLKEVARTAFVGGAEDESVEEVSVDTLADVWSFTAADAERVFLKVDTQGWDLEVLKGAGENLALVVGLQIEVAVLPLYEGAPTMADSLEALTAYGFGPTGFFPVAVDPGDGRIFEMDCIAVRVPR